MRRKRARGRARRALALVLALLLAAGLVPVQPVATFALAEEPGAVLELGDGADGAGVVAPGGAEEGVDAGVVLLDGAGQGEDGPGAQEEGQGDEIELADPDALVESGPAPEGGAQAPDGIAADPDVEVQASTSGVSVSNPRVRADGYRNAGKVATWDCVWLGSYPQTEIKLGDAIYGTLQSASWDANGDATVGGVRYRRVSRDDATYDGYWSGDGYGSATWRYFRFEAIRWRVLKVTGTTALVVADVALDDQRYNANYADVTWETSSIRSFLNGYGADANQPGADFSGKGFVDTAFSSGERSAIIQTKVVNADNAEYGTAGGNDTRDRVFLLSEAEACDAAHGFDSEERCCEVSDYAHAMGAWRSTDGGYEGNCWWWLRSPGYSAGCAANAGSGGYVDRWGNSVYYGYGAVRPALNLNLSSPHLKAAGTASSDGAPAEAGGGHEQTPADTPVIGVAHVPAYGTWDEDIRGRVFREDGSAFDPTAYRVAMFIQLGAGGQLYPKPYYTRPYASVSEDGTFQGDVTTGGRDDEAEIIHLFLVPGDYGSGDIADARERAVDYVGIYRSEDGGISVTPDRKVPRIAKGKTYKKSGMRYKVTRVTTASRKGTVTLTKAKNAKTVKVPASVRLADGRVYCVTAVSRGALKGLSKTTTVVVGSKVAKISAGAFSNLPKLTSVTLGTGVKKVGKGIFTNTPKLRTITVKSRLLKKKSAVKGMLKGSKVRKAVTVKVPKSVRKTYRKVFTKSNLACPKKVVVK